MRLFIVLSITATLATCATLPLAPALCADPSISHVVGMPVSAVGFSALYFVHLSAPDVFEMGHGLQVVRVDAGSNTAFMIKLHSVRDRANVNFVGYDVRAALDSIHGDARIAGSVQVSKPKPATGVRLRRDAIAQSVFNGFHLLNYARGGS